MKNCSTSKAAHFCRPIHWLIAASVACCVGPSSADPIPSKLVSFAPGQPASFETRPNQWDAAFRERGSIVRLDDGTLRLYYTGYDGTREGIKQIGLAFSTDNGQSWTRARDLPVTPADLWTEDPFVLRHTDGWQMFAEGAGDQGHRLTSKDGIKWTSAGRLDVRLADGSPIPPGPYGTPTVFVENDVWHLFYERRDAGIWLATSTDLAVWTNVSDEPVIKPGPTGFDAAMIALNQIIKHDGRYYAYYHGADKLEKPRAWAVGVAVSDDLQSWTKHSGNPITSPADNVSSGTIVFVEGPDHPPALFTTHAAVLVHRSGK